MGIESTKERFINSIKEDKEAELISILLVEYKDTILPNTYINNEQNFTALNIATAFGSIKSATFLLKNGWNVDYPERKEMNSNLLLACKFGYLELVKLYVENKADLYYVNSKKLNCLDMAIISGHYSIAYYLFSKKMSINSLCYYQKNIIEPSFDISLFYTTLTQNLLPEQAPSFALKNKQVLFNEICFMKRSKTINEKYNTTFIQEIEENQKQEYKIGSSHLLLDDSNILNNMPLASI